MSPFLPVEVLDSLVIGDNVDMEQINEVKNILIELDEAAHDFVCRHPNNVGAARLRQVLARAKVSIRNDPEMVKRQRPKLRLV